MRVFRGFDDLPQFHNAVVTMGSYDGVHHGHRQIIALLCEQARRLGGESIVMTFAPHPRQVLGLGQVRLLNSLEEKIMLLEQAGVDNLIVIPFDMEFSRISSERFITDYMVGRLGMKAAVVGYNHRFGHDKESGAEVLSRLKDRFGFEVTKVERYELDEKKISSTEIRKAIEVGDVALAAELLGRPYMMLADVRGERAVWSERDKMLPAAGRYEVRVDGERMTAEVTEGEVVLVGCEDRERVLIEFLAKE